MSRLRHWTSVAAVIAEELLLHGHVPTVPREEGALNTNSALVLIFVIVTAHLLDV